MMIIKTMSHQGWIAEGEKLFGPDHNFWRFRCPSCGHAMTVADWVRLAPAPTPKDGNLAFHAFMNHNMARVCVGGIRKAKGRAHNVVALGEKDKGSGCTHTGGGPVQVIDDINGLTRRVFEFYVPDHMLTPSQIDALEKAGVDTEDGIA